MVVGGTRQFLATIEQEQMTIGRDADIVKGRCDEMLPLQFTIPAYQSVRVPVRVFTLIFLFCTVWLCGSVHYFFLFFNSLCHWSPSDPSNGQTYSSFSSSIHLIFIYLFPFFFFLCVCLLFQGGCCYEGGRRWKSGWTDFPSRRGYRCGPIDHGVVVERERCSHAVSPSPPSGLLDFAVCWPM